MARLKYITERDEFGISRFSSFRRLDTLFSHAYIFIKKRYIFAWCLYVKCPKCGRIGKVAMWKCKSKSYPRYRIKHHRGHKPERFDYCVIGNTHEAYEFIDFLYHVYKMREHEG